MQKEKLNNYCKCCEVIYNTAQGYNYRDLTKLIQNITQTKSFEDARDVFHYDINEELHSIISESTSSMVANVLLKKYKVKITYMGNSNICLEVFFDSASEYRTVSSGTVIEMELVNDIYKNNISSDLFKDNIACINEEVKRSLRECVHKIFEKIKDSRENKMEEVK